MAHSDADHGPDHGHSHSHDHGHSHGHSHGPGHSHVPKVGVGNERKVLLAFLITFTFMVVEVAGGLISGSLALIADAGHMLTDAAALALSYGAFRFGRRAADRKRTFGYLRFEVIAGLINALALFAILIWISYEAFERFRSPSEILAGPMLIVAIIGLMVNLGVFWILSRGDSEHVNIKGALLHVLGDLLGSVAAIVAAIIIYFTGSGRFQRLFQHRLMAAMHAVEIADGHDRIAQMAGQMIGIAQAQDSHGSRHLTQGPAWSPPDCCHAFQGRR